MRVLFFNIATNRKENDELHVIGVFRTEYQAIQAAKRFIKFTPNVKEHRFAISTSLELNKLSLTKPTTSGQKWTTWATHPLEIDN